MTPVHELTTDQAVTELEQVCDQLMERSTPALLARQHELEAWILMHQAPAATQTEEPTKDPDPMPAKKKYKTELERREANREYNRKWAAKKAAEKKAAKPDVPTKSPKSDTSLKRVEETAVPTHVPAPEAVQTISRIRSSIWALMAALEHMTPAQRSDLVNDLALLDAAAHAAHQLALGRLEVT